MRNSLLIAAAAFVLVLNSACNNGSGGPTSPLGGGDITVKNPTSTTIWNTGQTYVVVQWEETEGDSVRVEVWKGSAKVGDFCDWTEDDGYHTRMDAIPESWGDGTDFKVKIIDNLGNTGLSAAFTLSSVVLPDGMSFVTIPTGSFQMGSPVGEDGARPSEQPVHTVIFDYSFEMMTTEVTQSMWQSMMDSNPSEFIGPNNPVNNVSHYDVDDFTAAMNTLDETYYYRLPTEAEWEYCCRATTNARFYWGPDPSDTMINEYAWWEGNSSGTIHPVGQKMANPWGLYDMCGNVREWCMDNHHDGYDGAPFDGSAWFNDAFTYRVVTRGGAWYDDADDLRSGARQFDTPTRESQNQGFRLVREKVKHE